VKILYTGDDARMPFQIMHGGVVMAIDPGDNVEAALRTIEGVLLAGPWLVLEATPESDWPNGIVVVEVDGTDTQALPEQPAQIEIQITTGGRRLTWSSRPIRVVSDTIP